MFSVIKNGFCTKLTSEFDGRFNQLTGIENQLDTYINSLKVDISSATYVPHKLINDFKNDVASNLANMVPSLTQFDELISLVDQCLFTKNNSMLSNPTITARGILNSVKSNADTLLSSLSTSIPSEFSIGKTINDLKGQLKTSNVNLLIPESTQALNCMSAICGTNINSRLAQLQAFLTKFSLSSIGEFDASSFLSGQGVSSYAIKSINAVTNQIESIYTQIESSFTSGIDRLKRLVPDDDE
jgi:hypothetical protein